MNKMLAPALTFLGCSLLALGNTFPWPCNPGVWYSMLCAASLDVWFQDTFIVVVFIAAMTMMLMLEVHFLPLPMNTFAWASYWIILYFLLVLKLRTDVAFPNFHDAVVHFTRNLVTFAITPLSLITYWLALRPEHLRQKYRGWMRVCLAALTLVTIFFLLFAMLALELQLRYSFQVKDAMKAAPVIILAGTLLLIGAEYAEVQLARPKDLSEDLNAEADLDQIEANIN